MRRIGGYGYPSEHEFQSTHPSGVRQSHRITSTATVGFQSTHPSGVRRAMEFRTPLTDVISIHAPQWGATTVDKASITDPAFQSTHPSGVRLNLFIQWRKMPFISIHAPQWGATGDSYAANTQNTHFNPRTPVGCDARRLAYCHKISLFQSTHPSGVRRIAYYQSRSAHQFQSTHPSGVRHQTFLFFRPAGLFQSTHPSGVRPREWA